MFAENVICYLNLSTYSGKQKMLAYIVICLKIFTKCWPKMLFRLKFAKIVQLTLLAKNVSDHVRVAIQAETKKYHLYGRLKPSFKICEHCQRTCSRWCVRKNVHEQCYLPKNIFHSIQQAKMLFHLKFSNVVRGGVDTA